jgi:hypothetical protein
MLRFQRLDVHQRAIEFLGLVGDIVDELPKDIRCAPTGQLVELIGGPRSIDMGK